MRGPHKKDSRILWPILGSSIQENCNLWSCKDALVSIVGPEWAITPSLDYQVSSVLLTAEKRVSQNTPLWLYMYTCMGTLLYITWFGVQGFGTMFTPSL